MKTILFHIFPVRCVHMKCSILANTCGYKRLTSFEFRNSNASCFEFCGLILPFHSDALKLRKSGDFKTNVSRINVIKPVIQKNPFESKTLTCFKWYETRRNCSNERRTNFTVKNPTSQKVKSLHLTFDFKYSGAIIFFLSTI